MNKTYIAIGIAVAMLGSVIAVEYFYGWSNVKEDVESMGKCVWFKFTKWVGVKNGNKTVLMPEEYARDEEIVRTETRIQEQLEKIPFVGRVVEMTSNILNRLTNEITRNIEYVRSVNTTKLSEQLSAAIGTSVEFVSISISKGREVLIPLECATRRALGEELPKFIASVQKSLQEFFSSAEIQSFVYSIMEIPQNVIQSIQGALISYTGSTFAGVTEIADKVDWWV